MVNVNMVSILNASKIFNDISTINFPAVTAFKIARIQREMNKEIEAFEKERAAIAQKYGERDEDGNLKVDNGNVIIQADKIEECNQELEALFSTEISLNVNKLNFDEVNGAEMTAQQAMGIIDFIEME